MNDRTNLRTRASQFVNTTKAKAYGVGAAAMTAAPFAFAQEGFDAAAITAKIDSNVLLASSIIGAFILGVWTLRSMGLLKRS